MTDAYLYIDGIKGESTDIEHQGWTDIIAVSTALPTRPVSAAGTISVTKKTDSSSPKLHTLCSSGTHIAKANLEYRPAGGTTNQKFLSIQMSQVMITNVSVSSARVQIPPASTLLTETITLKFASSSTT